MSIDNAPALTLLDSGLAVVHRQHEITGQQLVVIGSDHTFSKEPGDADMQDCLTVTKEFFTETAGEARESFIEGRIPMTWHRGKLFGDGRTPVIDTIDMWSATASHSEAGIITCLGLINNTPPRSIDDDRRIISDVQAEGFAPLSIMRYLTWRMIPQYAREASGVNLKAYLERHALRRYQTLMGKDWAAFHPTLKEVMDGHAHLVQDYNTSVSLNEVTYFLAQTISYANDADRASIAVQSETQRVSASFTQRRRAHYRDTLGNGWGEPGTPHRLAGIGLTHLLAIAPDLQAL